MAPSVLEDKDYYYGTATLAQVLLELGDDRAAEYFLSAQESIRNSFDLVTIAETRSKILIRLVAALCCLHSSDDAEAAKRYLGEASDLIEELPRLEGKICTVFSPLSKWNEEAEVIKRHIEWIREGRVFAWRERRSVTRHHPEAELATNSGNDVVQTCASSQKMARTETGQLVTSNRPKIVRRHDHRVLHAIAVESLRGRRRDAPPMSVGLNVCCAPTRELRAQTAATLLSVEADALPDTTDRTSNRESRFGLLVRRPCVFVAEFSSEDKILRRSTRVEHWNIFPVHREYSIRPFAHIRLRH